MYAHINGRTEMAFFFKAARQAGKSGFSRSSVSNRQAEKGVSR